MAEIFATIAATLILGVPLLVIVAFMAALGWRLVAWQLAKIPRRKEM